MGCASKVRERQAARKGSFGGSAGASIRVFERLFDQRDALFHALAQRAVDFCWRSRRREQLVGDIQRRQHGYLQRVDRARGLATSRILSST